MMSEQQGRGENLKIIGSYNKQVKRGEVFVENTVLHAEILQLLDLKGKYITVAI